jgi:hypothetical protein
MQQAYALTGGFAPRCSDCSLLRTLLLTSSTDHLNSLFLLSNKNQKYRCFANARPTDAWWVASARLASQEADRGPKKEKM